ncbi:calpastatin isoform X4 [Neolamprologus brichardi]|uniref:calpastatin isoform X4 n=1 Tax=Neolamprologus brichardi TaxID=32507 RepID=UPI0003EBBF6E|nr:calpastatin isoform X4 [Neolamprologus brichardi]
MPHKKRSHGHHKATKEAKDESQSSQTTPKPAAQVSTGKPAQFETPTSGSGMATKPEAVTTTTGGSSNVATAGKAAPKAKPETAPVSQAKVAPTIPPTAGTAAATSVAAPKESPKDTAKSATAATVVKADVPKVDPAKTSKPAAAGTAAAGNVSVQGKKEEAKSAQTKVQAEVTSTAAKGAQQAPPVDAIDELANILPSTDSFARPEPVFTGPEVKEHDITSEKGQKCGERDDTLPPNYRFKNTGRAPADAKPVDVPKPLSTDAALDSLSADFKSTGQPGPKKQEQKVHVETISASSAGPANFAPPPVKKAETPAAVPPMAAPPADKKAKMEKVSDDFSLEAGLSSSSTKAVSPAAAPADKKAKMDKTTPVKAGLDTKAGTKPKTSEGDSMSLDALGALCDTLPKDAPKPEPPKVRPQDIVSEGKVKSEKGVRVGEREDTLPPDYRFKEEDLKKLPPPKPEPKMDADDALDILSGDFSTASTAPAVQAPVCSSAAPVQKSPAPPTDKKAKVEAGLSATTAKKVESAAAPPAAGPGAPSAEKKAQQHKPAAGKDTKPETNKGGSMSLDALSALGDTLPADAPKPESPELKPKDIVSEGKVKAEEGVRVGERDDTLPPDYRFKDKDPKKLPPPKPEPKMDTDDAVDILSGDFSLSSAPPLVVCLPPAPVVCLPPPPPVVCSIDLPPVVLFEAPPPVVCYASPKLFKEVSPVLSEEFVASSEASGVHAPVPPPSQKPPEKTVCPVEQPNKVDVSTQQTKPKIEKGDSISLDALSALSETLPTEAPKPESPELRPEDIVPEGKVKKEKGVRVGEREDTLPPDYRFKEEDLKKLPAPKPEPKINTDDALDILSGDFSSSAAPAVQAPVVCSSAPPAQASADAALKSLAGDLVASSAAPAVKSEPRIPTQTKPQLEAGADNALDALSDTLGDIKPVPQPAPGPVKDPVKEKTIAEEKLIKMGERDDALPPEYRPTEEDRKKMEEAKKKAATIPKEKSMDETTALEMLSSDFSDAPKPGAPVTSCAATTKLEPPALDSAPLKPMAGPVLESLSDTLLPDPVKGKSKTDKPKGKSKSKPKSKKQQAEEPSAPDQLSAQRSSDVVPTSTKKGAKS